MIYKLASSRLELSNGVKIGGFQYFAYSFLSALSNGDISGDGKVTAYDTVLIFQHITGLITLSKEQQDGDIDGQDVLTVNDARLILRKAIGLIDEF